MKRSFLIVVLIVLSIASCFSNSDEYLDEIVDKTAMVLMFEEGFRSNPYLDSQGYVTVGFGTKLTHKRNMNPNRFHSMSFNKAKSKMIERIKLDNKKLLGSKKGYVYKRLSVDQRVVLLSMSYQIGWVGLTKFKKTWLLLEEGNYYGARAQALTSLWAKQTRGRAIRTLKVLAGWDLFDVYTYKVRGIQE